MLDVEPSGTMTLYSADVTDIVFDCASLADICAKFSSVSDSQIRIGVAEPRVVGALLTTQPTLTDAPGTQSNDIWIISRSTNSAYSPTGILFNGDSSSSYNISYNRVHYLSAWYQNGDGIVFGNSDTNLIYDLEATRQPGGTGSPVVFAPSNYLMPNGNRTSSNLANSNQQVYHAGTAISVFGYRAGATLTPGAGNAGSGADTPITLTTNAQGDGRHIYFASTAGLGVNMQFTCGGPISGVPNYVPIARLSTDTGVAVEPGYDNGSVASGTTCKFDYGITAKAVTGTYTVTAENATTFDITAPSGGNSQTGVTVSSGVLSFTDMVFPWSGSASAGDTWTVVVPRAPHNIQIDGVDSINGVSEPYFAPGVTSASYTFIGNPYPFITPPTYNGGINLSGYSSSFCTNLSPAAPGQNSIIMGLCGGAATGAFEVAIGGLNTSVTNGTASVIIGGENNSTVNSSFSFIGGGQSNKITGTQYSRAGGGFTSDNGRIGADVWGSGDFATQGDAQTGKIVLRGKGTTSGGAIRLTSDGNAAGSANCMNVPLNGAYGFTAMLVATDKTTPGSSWAAMWGGGSVGPHIIAHTSTSTLLDGVTTTVNPDGTRSVGTTTGIGATIARDNANSCIDVEFTHPTNTDQWDAVIVITSGEVG